MRRVAAVAVAALLLFATGALTRVRYSPASADAAVLRLSWRTRAEAKQLCRDRTAEELEALPVHMRTPQVCTPIPLRYELSVRIDDGPTYVRRLHAAGARADRPVYVFREQPITPGRHRITVEFRRPDQHDDDDDDDDHGRRDVLRLRRRVVVRPGDILLVTYDDERRELYIPNPAHRGEHEGRDDSDE